VRPAIPPTEHFVEPRTLHCICNAGNTANRKILRAVMNESTGERHASALRGNLTTTSIFRTRTKPCRIAVRADVGSFCRKGLRSVAATSDLTRFATKIMSPEVTAPLFVSPCDVPLTVRLAAIWKILSGRKDLQKSQKHINVKLLFPNAIGRRSTTGLPEQMLCETLRLERLASPQAHSAQPRSLLRALRPNSPRQSLNG